MSDFLQAARHTDRNRPLPHQDAAWHWAWTLLSKQQQAEFLELFRADPPDQLPVANSWAGIAAAAKRSGARYPELVAAQWQLESHGGTAMAARNNPFGIKGQGTVSRTSEVVGGKTIEIDAEFQDFSDLAEAVDYLVSRWHRDWTDGRGRHYRGCNGCATREEAALHLSREGYATDPAYSKKLIALMREHAPIAQVVPVEGFTPQSSFDLRITPHFTYGEFALGQEARRFQHPYQCRVALELAQFLETLRTAFGNKAVIITSGYRPDAINRACGGARDSEHLFSAPGVGAVDVAVDGVSAAEVQRWIDKHWPFSVGYGAEKGFVHVGRRADGGRRRWDY